MEEDNIQSENIYFSKPDPNCSLCHGELMNPPCNCIIEQEIFYYLTSIYGGGISYPNQYSKFPIEKMKDDFYFEGVPEMKFKEFVKNFLIRSINPKDIDCRRRWMKHQTVSGFYLMEVKFGKIEGVALTKLMSSPEFLIINLFSSDPPNSMYQYTLETLCKGRKDHAKLTWINSEYSIDSGLFKDRYSSAFSQYVKDKTHYNKANI